MPIDGAASRVMDTSIEADASPNAQRLSERKSARNSTSSSPPARLSRMNSTTCTTTSVFEEIGGESLNAKLDKQAMWADVTRLKIRLKHSNRMLLNPRSKFMQYWDFVTLAALFFTATVTPYEVCMMWAATKVDALFIVNYMINFVFIIDIVFNFFLPVRGCNSIRS